MSDAASPFTVGSLTALLDADGVRYARGDDGAICVRFGCDRVPHELRIVVNEWVGYCAITQHDLGLVIPSLAGEDHAGDVCRLALMLNGEALFGSFMLWGYRGTSLSYGVVLPTTDAELTLSQLQTAIGAVCHEVDLCYPLLQQVLWGALTSAEALERYRAHRYGEADDEPLESSDGSAPTAGERDEQPAETEQPARAQRRRRTDGSSDTAAEIDCIDESFLRGYDRADPFSSAAAEAILRLRTDDPPGEDATGAA